MRYARIALLSVLICAVSLALSGCNSYLLNSSAGAGSTHGTDAFSVSIDTVVPAVNATCVNATTAITIPFDEAPEASTLTANNLAVSGPWGGIPVKISANATTTQVVLTPTSPLPSGMITVTVNNVRDLADQLITSPYMWSFSTNCDSSGSGTGMEYIYFQGWRTNGDAFYAYAIDPMTGNLSPVPDMPFQFNTDGVAVVSGADQVLIQLLADPLGRFLFYDYGSGFGTMTVDPATGSLTNDDVLADPGIGYTGLSPTVSTDPQGRFIYATASTGNSLAIDALVVGSNGNLSLAPGQPVQFQGTSAQAPAVSGQYVYVSDQNPEPSNLYGFSINQTSGALSSASTTGAGYFANSQVITPSGKFLYAVNDSASMIPNGDDQIVGYQVNSDGSLTPLPDPPQLTNTPGGGATMIMSPNGNFLYFIAGPGFDTVGGFEFRIYAINQNTGSLSLTAAYSYDNAPQWVFGTQSAVAIDPAVKYVYIPQASNYAGTFTLQGFTVNPSTGALAPIPGAGYSVPLELLPASVAHTSMVIVRPE